MYFDQLLDFQILLFYSFTLYYCVIFYPLDARFFQYHPGVKKFGPDLGPNCLQRLSVDIAGKELNTKKLDTFWLKPWLKLMSFGSNFFPFG